MQTPTPPSADHPPHPMQFAKLSKLQFRPIQIHSFGKQLHLNGLPQRASFSESERNRRFWRTLINRWLKRATSFRGIVLNFASMITVVNFGQLLVIAWKRSQASVITSILQSPNTSCFLGDAEIHQGVF
ncbi:hypothetical protein CDAR_422601 [Caerostris darwini]|uniref:Uncharacterized protein n=1 Tax=Caerostris darwini TaxID=1538125 RepID=A0AAV4VVZ3_9ARAC|nr:hypothetical protein CDAR_422601 [Caerostris darwini]